MQSVGPNREASRHKRHMRVILARGEAITSIRVRPWMVAAVTGLALAFGTLYLSATAYLVLRDDFLQASIAKQGEIRDGYEQRIADLRAQIDRLKSRHLVTQQALESEIERLAGRQAALDARQDIIAGLSQAARRAGIVSTTGQPNTAGEEEAAAPAPEQTLRGAHLRGTPVDASSDRSAQIDATRAAAARLAERQAAYVDAIADAVAGRADRIVEVLSGLGVSEQHLGEAAVANVGGPFVAPVDTGDADFRSTVETVAVEIERFNKIQALAGAIPVERPIDAPVTSGFGRRIDPFLRRPAMHGGIDFRAKTGAAVRATALGVVVSAKYRGGYGKMVEIDHGNGFRTRFAHLSRISVSLGQRVRSGDILGKVGSTGRSTGPHLHYEVRRNDRPVDPAPFLKAGADIAQLRGSNS